MASNNLVVAVKPVLDKVGIDVIAQILSFVDPKDIVMLQRVCKGLATASRERVVWRNALRLVSEQHGIYTATFPIRDMTTAQLQHAATSPAKFTAFLRQELRPPKNKLPVELIEPKLTRELPGNCCFERAFLVPGGRYILTMIYTETESYLMELWDIGFSTDSVTPSSIASKDFNDHTVVIIGLQPITTRDGLLVMLEVMPDNR